MGKSGALVVAVERDAMSKNHFFLRRRTKDSFTYECESNHVPVPVDRLKTTYTMATHGRVWTPIDLSEAIDSAADTLENFGNWLFDTEENLKNLMIDTVRLIDGLLVSTRTGADKDIWLHMYLTMGRFDAYRQTFSRDAICQGHLVTGTVLRAIHEFSATTEDIDPYRDRLNKLINEFRRIVVNGIPVILSLYGDDSKMIDARLFLGPGYQPNYDMFEKFEQQINRTILRASENPCRASAVLVNRLSSKHREHYWEHPIVTNNNHAYDFHDEFWHPIVRGIQVARSAKTVQLRIGDNSKHRDMYIATATVSRHPAYQLDIPKQYLRTCCRNILV